MYIEFETNLFQNLKPICSSNHEQNQSLIAYITIRMCLIVFAYKCHPQYPFILAGNRDEFHDRPALPLHKWDTSPPIIAGRDKEAGGTWLGVSETGKVAALTNYRDIENIKENAPSRGEIIPNFLLSNEQPEHTLNSVDKRAHFYNGFNLIAGDIDQLYYLSNHGHSVEPIQPGVHVISNAALNTPWPKALWALNRFKTILESDDLDQAQFFELLQNSDRYPPKILPETGLSEEMEVAVSSVFILTEHYGTRSSSLITIDRNLQLNFIEKVYKPGTKIEVNQSEISLKLQSTDQ